MTTKPCPAWIPHHGKNLWAKLKPADNHQAFEMMCAAYGNYRQAQEDLAKEGLYTGGKLHPAHQLQKQAFDQFVKLWKELRNKESQDKVINLDALLEGD